MIITRGRAGSDTALHSSSDAALAAVPTDCSKGFTGGGGQTIHLEVLLRARVFCCSCLNERAIVPTHGPTAWTHSRRTMPQRINHVGMQQVSAARKRLTEVITCALPHLTDAIRRRGGTPPSGEISAGEVVSDLSTARFNGLVRILILDRCLGINTWELHGVVSIALSCASRFTPCGVVLDEDGNGATHRLGHRFSISSG